MQIPACLALLERVNSLSLSHPPANRGAFYNRVSGITNASCFMSVRWLWP